MADEMPLTQWWQTTWSDLRLPLPATALLDELLARYAEPHRAYHTVRHLEECCAQFTRARSLAGDPGVIAIALWFHDAIYDTRSTSNEDESAAWAARVLTDAGATNERVASVRAMILATKHNAVPDSTDAALMVDVDLSILGSSASRFAEYETQVRQEYAWVPEDAFRSARARILGEFLARPRIYFSDFFRNDLEAQARSNLQASLGH